MFAFNNQKLSEIGEQIFELDFIETKFASFRDCRFNDNIGSKASAVYLQDSKLAMIGTIDIENFFNNKTPYGQTISAFNSEIVTKRMFFRKNKA